MLDDVKEKVLLGPLPTCPFCDGEAVYIGEGEGRKLIHHVGRDRCPMANATIQLEIWLNRPGERRLQDKIEAFKVRANDLHKYYDNLANDLADGLHTISEMMKIC